MYVNKETHNTEAWISPCCLGMAPLTGHLSTWANIFHLSGNLYVLKWYTKSTEMHTKPNVMLQEDHYFPV